MHVLTNKENKLPQKVTPLEPMKVVEEHVLHAQEFPLACTKITSCMHQNYFLHAPKSSRRRLRLYAQKLRKFCF